MRMDPLPRLPLAVEELPAGLRRFGDPKAPTAARAMAAKGLVPVKGGDLITLLCQLANDPDEGVVAAAEKTLAGMPEGVLLAACDAPIHPSVIDDLARRFAKRDDVLGRLCANHATADSTVAEIARGCSESVTEIIATNQQRLLAAPLIIERLYKNKNTRMSTADRLVELAARNDVEVTGIPAFKAHAEAIRGQLIPEPTDEPLPTDGMFQDALAADSDEDAFEASDDDDDDEEEMKEKFKPLAFRVRDMSTAEKIRLSVIGNSAARALLVRDSNRMVSFAAITSPSMSAAEASGIAHSKEVGEDILRYIGNRKEWARSYEIKIALVFNPKTPVGIALRFISHLRANDLKTVAKSRNVPSPVKSAASQRIQKREQKQKNKK